MVRNMIPKISVIMPYCSNDYRFLRPNILQLLKFTDSIYIIYSDCFWNGELENEEIISKSINENSEVEFIKVPYVHKNPPIPELLCRLIPKRFIFRPVYGPRYFEGLVRWKGYLKAKKDNPDYFLFLDTDEIVDAHRFMKWLKKGLNLKLNAMIFSSYEYLKSPRFQAKNWSDKVVLVKNINIAKKDFFTYWIRKRFYQTSPPPKRKNVVGLDGLPMVHHYSWIRDEKQFLKKVDITSIHGLSNRKKRRIKKEFSKQLSDQETVWGKEFVKVEPFIDLQ